MGVKDVKAGRRRGVSDGRRGERVVNVLFGVEVSFRSKVGARIGVRESVPRSGRDGFGEDRSREACEGLHLGDGAAGLAECRLLMVGLGVGDVWS